MNLNDSFRNIIHPFTKINDLLKAIYIAKKLYSEALDNIEQISNAFKELLKISLSFSSIKNFIILINNYENDYPVDLLLNFDKFKQTTNDYFHSKNECSFTLTSETTTCYFCNYTSTNNKTWYKLVNYRKPASLFAYDGMGKF